MADESRALVFDNKSEVAYQMALKMFMEAEGAPPGLEDKVIFLRLVQDCTRALTPRFPFEYEGS